MFSVGIAFTGIEKLGIRKLNGIIRESLRDVGDYWHDNMLRKHFTKAGAREYQYTPRQGEPGSGRAFKGSYVSRKIKTQGHSLPLVWSGETRDQLLRTKSIEARCSQRGERAYVIVRLNAPQLNRNNSKIKKHEEIRRVSQPELRELEGVLVRQLDSRLTQAGQANAAGLASITAG